MTMTFAPDSMSVTEALRTANLPEPRSLPQFADRNRITQAPAEFVKIHPRTHEITGGIVCRTHTVWTDGCDYCDRAMAKRIAARAERMANHIRSIAKTGRFGK